MKILGTTKSDTFLCEITLHEIQKVMENAYGGGSTTSHYCRLSVGQEIDIANGYNFRVKIEQLCRDMNQAYKSFESSSNTLLNFTKLISKDHDS